MFWKVLSHFLGSSVTAERSDVFIDLSSQEAEQVVPRYAHICLAGGVSSVTLGDDITGSKSELLGFESRDQALLIAGFPALVSVVDRVPNCCSLHAALLLH